jgi:hypothetical protein
MLGGVEETDSSRIAQGLIYSQVLRGVDDTGVGRLSMFEREGNTKGSG